MAMRTRATADLRRPTPQTNLRGPVGAAGTSGAGAAATAGVVSSDMIGFTCYGKIFDVDEVGKLQNLHADAELRQLQRLGLLGAVRMLIALVDFQLGQDVAAHLALG